MLRMSCHVANSFIHLIACYKSRDTLGPQMNHMHLLNLKSFINSVYMCPFKAYLQSHVHVASNVYTLIKKVHAQLIPKLNHNQIRIL